MTPWEGCRRHFLKVTAVRLIEGRDIYVDSDPTDSAALLVNEATVKAMNMKEPVGVQAVRASLSKPVDSIRVD
ncbi:hypothetical protein [Arcticibacter sp. MXS-1]|uniref:hypothetical protein n=1 Tax=Arcticibacter sp. MXS-1 TaxID=3341726 RepID=UPI0035A96BAB